MYEWNARIKTSVGSRKQINDFSTQLLICNTKIFFFFFLNIEWFLFEIDVFKM